MLISPFCSIARLPSPSIFIFFFFFFNDTATTEIYTLSLHDALPIYYDVDGQCAAALLTRVLRSVGAQVQAFVPHRSEEHTSELQSLAYLVCRLLLEKKKKNETTDCVPR